MKICLPTAGPRGLPEMVSDHFGSAPFFTIYDTDTQAIQVVSNDNQHHAHGACQPLTAIAKYNVNAILTKGVGRRAVQLLNEAGLKVYLLNGNTVEEAVKRFQANELVELTWENACGGHGCQ